MKLIQSTIAAVAITMATLAPASAQTIWRESNWLPPGHPVWAGIVESWSKQVEVVTQGRIKIQSVPALGAPPAHFDLVRTGVADVALIVLNYTPNRFVLPQIIEMPFLSDKAIGPSIATWRMHEKFFAPSNEWQGVKLVSVWANSPGHIFTIAKPINSVADLKGMKIRTAGGISDTTTSLAGALPFFAPASATYDVLSKGVADGIVFPAESVPGFKLDTLVKYATLVPGGTFRSNHALILNQAKWDALSAADKEAVSEISGETLARIAGTVWDERDAWGFDVMKKAGIKFNSAPPEMVADLRSRYANLIETWYGDAAKKKVDGKAVNAFMQQTIHEVEASLKKTN